MSAFQLMEGERARRVAVPRRHCSSVGQLVPAPGDGGDGTEQGRRRVGKPVIIGNGAIGSDSRKHSVDHLVILEKRFRCSAVAAEPADELCVRKSGGGWFGAWQIRSTRRGNNEIGGRVNAPTGQFDAELIGYQRSEAVAEEDQRRSQLSDEVLCDSLGDDLCGLAVRGGCIQGGIPDSEQLHGGRKLGCPWARVHGRTARVREEEDAHRRAQLRAEGHQRPYHCTAVYPCFVQDHRRICLLLADRIWFDASEREAAPPCGWQSAKRLPGLVFCAELSMHDGVRPSEARSAQVIVLGIGAGNFERVDEVRSRRVGVHDSSATLVKDGDIIASAEEERFSRYKHSGKLPLGAVRHCLASAGVAPGDVDKYVFCARESDFNATLKTAYDVQLVDDCRRIRPFIQRILRRELACHVDSRRFEFIDHHYAHAVSAFVPSGFARALVVTLDGVGAGISGSVWLGESGKLKHIRDYDGHVLPVTQSLGRLYELITAFLGFKSFDQGKVMGLAAYGNAGRFRPLFAKLYELGAGGDYRIHLSRIDLIAQVCPPVQRGERLQIHLDIAAALQDAVETIALHVLCFHRELTQANNLCLAGGVAQNCVLNGRILKERMFDGMFVQPACHDGGLSLGAALHGCGDRTGPARTTVMTHVYLGTPCGGDADIERQLHPWRDCIDYQLTRGIAEAAAGIIAAGEVLGWVQGRAELGPRALGNRSIVADPRPAENRDIINKMVKKREAFRPFAPSVLEERAEEYFEMPAPAARFAFMTFSVNVRERYRSLLGAVTHFDGSARIQTVSRESNELYWELISAFARRTGVPMLLNTSFNNDAEPIVDTAMDAIVCYLTTNLDVLAIGNFLIRKKRKELAVHREWSLELPDYARIHEGSGQVARTRAAAGDESSPLYQRLLNKLYAPRVAHGRGDDPAATFYLEDTHEGRSILVSDNMARVLIDADGYTPMGEAIAGFAPLEQEQLLAEALRLWERRWIKVLPRLQCAPRGRWGGGP